MTLYFGGSQGSCFEMGSINLDDLVTTIEASVADIPMINSEEKSQDKRKLKTYQYQKIIIINYSGKL